MTDSGVDHLYIRQDNKRLRCGYTTGSCAAGAAAAACRMLLTGVDLSLSEVHTPKGIDLHLEIFNISRSVDAVSCAVRKDGGDDIDATNGILVFAEVKKLSAVALTQDQIASNFPDLSHAFVRCCQQFTLVLTGGEGVGTVTRAGLKQDIGQSAINPVPQKMIFDHVERVADDFDFSGTLLITVSVPEGAAIAQKTFNPRLGIIGGISILGTSGIVEPMSEAALIASIQLEMRTRAAAGDRYLVIVPGNYGEDYVRGSLGISLKDPPVQCSNFVGETVDEAASLGLKGLLFVSHIGKFIKVAGGIMNTHSRHSDCRAELCTAFALRAGADRDTAMKILDTETTDEAVNIMEAAGVRDEAMRLAAGKVRDYLRHRCGGALETEAILFNTVYGELARTEGADEMIRKITKVNTG